MKMKMVCVKRSFVFAALVLAFANQMPAANGIWYSTNGVARNTYWTNSWNWSAQPFPAGNQTATFNNGVNITNTTINIEGLAIISNIVFDTTGAGAYTIGSNGVNQQTLVLTNGSTIQLTSSALNSQRFDAMLQLGHERTNSTHTLRNDHSFNALTFAGNLFSASGGVGTGTKTLNVAGIGAVTISGNITTNGYSPLTLTDTTLGNLLLTGANTVNTLNASGGPLTLTGTNRINTFNVTGGAATLAGSNVVDTVTLTGGTLALAGLNRITTLNVNASGPVSLSGTNVLSTLNLNGTGNSTVNVTAGALVFENGGGGTMIANQDAVINGPGSIVLPTGPANNLTGDNYSAPGKTLTINARLTGNIGLELWSGTGTYVLNGPNDFTGNVTMGPAGTLSVSKIGNKGSLTSNLGSGTTVTLNASGTRLLYTGSGESSDRILSILSNVIVEDAGTGHLNLTAPLTVSTSGAKTLTLQGSSAGTAEFSGLLRNDAGTLALVKDGTGQWLLSTTNTYTGTTAVNGGTLSLAGAYGAIAASTGYTLAAGGTLLLDNTASANNTNRLRDASALTLNGGTLRFANAGGSADYSENAGAVTANLNASTIAAAQADAGRTATLRFASLARAAGATVNFAGAGLGVDSRNRIFITAQADGLIGPWATVNNTNLAAYSSSEGVYAAADAAYADIAARGPSTILSNDTSNVRISSDGTSGSIQLDSATTRIASLLQNTATPATVNTADKTLQTGNIIIPAGQASVTIGQSPNEGTLSAVTENGELALNNDSANGLVVNAVIADNGAASKLTKYGKGTLTLAASNTFSGTLAVSGGSILLANSDALQGVTLAATGTVFDSSVSSHAFTLGGLAGSVNVSLADNAGSPNPVALTVGKNNADTLHGGVLSGNGGVAKVGAGTLTLSGANTFLGGLSVDQGTVAASNANALGNSGIVDSGTLNLAATGSDITYSGLSNSLSGAGTVNVWLATGGATTRLNGDYSGFTGVWNIGTNAAAGAAKVMMNGADNAAATVNILANGTVMCAAGTHAATAVLNGGDTGESVGQLRLDNGAIWAGPVRLAGPMTATGDGYIGGSSGQSVISGTIDDLGAGYTLDKVGNGTNYLTANNTFAGPVWIKSGGIRVDTIGSVGGGAGPLGNPVTAADGTLRFGIVNTNGSLVYTGPGETTDRLIEMAGTTATTYLWHNGSNVLTLAGNVISTADGGKRLTLHGMTAGATGIVAGVISDFGISSNNLFKTGPVTWTLTANNTFKGSVTVEDGALRITKSEAFGNWPKIVAAANNANGANPHIHLDGTDGDLVIPTNITFRTSNSRVGAIFNEAGTNTILGPVQLTSGDGETILNSVAGKLILSGSVSPVAADRQLRLRGDGAGEIAGVIDNGATTVGLPVIRDGGTGTWTLSASNTYSGLTTANNGTLVIGGTNGFIGGVVTVNPTGTFVIANSALSNSVNRLGDTGPVTLNGGVFSYSHTGGAASYSETAGALIVNSSSNILMTSRADEGQSSILTWASLTRNGTAAIDFRGEGLGVDSRNRLLFSTSPGTGLLGLWATYNATNFAAYDNTLGVVAAGDSLFTDLAAKGPSAIPNDPALNARINSEGTAGPVALAGAPSSSIKSLLQNTVWASTVGMTNQTLLVNDLMIAAGQQALTLGTAENEGLIMPLTAGGTLTLNNPSDNALTLNAAVTNNTTASKVVKTGSGPVKLNGVNSYTGATLIDAGTLEFGGAATQTLAGVISGAGGLVKNGVGTLTLPAANTYLGPTTVKQGILVAKNSAAFGSAVSGTVIESGATLDVGGAAKDSLNLGNEQFTVSGAGVGGQGAIINSSTGTQQNAFGKITLAGDTTFGGAQRWDLRSSTPTLTMNGYDLTKISNNLIDIVSATILPDGPGGTGAIDVQGGALILDSATKFNGSAANTLRIRSGAQLQTYNFSAANPAVWTMLLDHNATVATLQGAGNGTINTWSGPVTLDGTATLTGGNTGWSLTLSGPVSGPGSITKTGASVAYLTGTNNTYGGTTIVSNGTLYANYAGSLPGYDAGKVTLVGGATLAVRTGDGSTGWSSEQLSRLHDASSFSANTAVLSVDTVQSNLYYTGNLTKPLALAKQSNNTLTLAGTNTFTGAVTVNGGTLAFGNASTNLVGAVTVNNAGLLTFNGPGFNTNGSVTINNSGAVVYAGASTNYAGSVTVNTLGTLTFAPGSTNSVGSLTAKGSSAVNVDGRLTLAGNTLTAGNASGDRPTVTFTTNAYMARLYAGNGALSAGAVIQNGGAVTIAPAQSGQDVLSLGVSGGYGYYRMNGGTLTAGQFALTGNGAGVNYAVFDQYGGDITVSSTGGWLIWGWQGGSGVLNMFGGSLANPPSGNDTTMAFVANRNCFGMLNLLGSNAVFNSTVNSRSINLASTAGNMASVINLNAGTLIANRIFATVPTTPTFVNFGGGTLKANTAQTQFLQGLSFATVYPGGAVIDSSNIAVTVNQPLQAPTGYGVSGVTLITGGLGYIGAPVVLITGGSGTGATAVAAVDLAPASPTAGQVTGVTVTSPGTGYQPGDMVLVTLRGGGFTNNAAAVAYNAALAPNAASGGLTKLGSGTLTLGGANTYGGTTTVSNGTLKLGQALALPTGTPVALAGGTLDLGGFTVTNTVSGSGIISNGTLFAEISPAGTNVIGTQSFALKAATLKGAYLADVTADGASDLVSVQGNLDLANLTLQIVDPSRLNRSQTYTLATCTGTLSNAFSATNLPDSRWHVLRGADGAVRLIFADGTIMLLK